MRSRSPGRCWPAASTPWRSRCAHPRPSTPFGQSPSRCRRWRSGPEPSFGRTRHGRRYTQAPVSWCRRAARHACWTALLDQAAPKHFAGSQDSSRGHLLPHRGYRPGGGRRLPRAAQRRVCRRIVAYAKQSRRHTELGRHRRTCGRCQRRCPARMFSCPTARMRRPSGADWHHKGPSHVRSSRSHAGSPSAKSHRTARQRRRPPDPLSRAHRRR